MTNLDPVYKELAARINMENSETMQKILAKLATPEQAKVILELPKPSEEIAQKLNLNKEKIEEYIQEMVEKGLVVRTRRGPRMPRSEGQLHDLQNNEKFDKELGPEYFALWRQLMKELGPERRKRRVASQQPATGRIIPRWNAVKDIPGILPFEDVSKILKAHSPVALIHCACKKINNDRACGVPDECCIIFGRTAEFNVHDRKCARELTYDEAMALIEKLDKQPVIHLVPNVRDVGILLCNCHNDCCDVLKPWVDENGKVSPDWRKTHAPSRFIATVDPENCRACKLCVTRCQFGAAQMKFYPELGQERAFIDTEICMGCGSCVVTCPGKVRAMELVRTPEHVPADLGHVFWENTGT